MKKILFLTAVIAALCAGLHPRAYAEDAQTPAAAPQQTERHNALVWKDNSRAMFDRVIQSTPDFVRPLSEQKLREAVTAKAGTGGTVTEDMVIECTKEVTPAPFVDQTLKDLQALKTK